MLERGGPSLNTEVRVRSQILLLSFFTPWRSFKTLTRVTSLSSAQAEWVASTSPYPLSHKQSYGKIVEEPFRRYGDAIAWLDWYDDCVITKIESLKPRVGAAGSLLAFLKALAVKHGIRIYGNPVVYEPTCRLAAASPLSQEELEAWYAKHGFLVGRSVNGVPYIWYPSVGPNTALEPAITRH